MKLKSIWQGFNKWRHRGMPFRVTVLLLIGVAPFIEYNMTDQHIPCNIGFKLSPQMHLDQNIAFLIIAMLFGAALPKLTQLTKTERIINSVMIIALLLVIIQLIFPPFDLYSKITYSSDNLKQHLVLL